MVHPENAVQEDDGGLVLPVLTMDQFAAELGPPENYPTQAMIEAGWEVLDAEGLPCPPVETMTAMWRAMAMAR